MNKYLIILLILPAWASAQTLYVPNGTGGISASPNGSVGIGTSTPDATYKLDIHGGGIHVANPAANGYNFVGRDNNYSYFYHRMTTSFHMMGSNRNSGGTLRSLGFAVGGADGENDIKMSIAPDGNVKIGGGTPRGKFDVDGPGDIYLVDDPNPGTNQSVFLPGHIYISPYNGQNVSYLQARRLDNSGSTSLRIRTYNSGNLTEAIHIESDGDVGIGTVSPDAKLTVRGDIHTREVRVDMTGATGPDYVFEKDYNLLPLSELKAYINENKHLPEVPSAKEMEANGLNLKEMNLILLKKVEELTLHLIKANERIEDLDKQVQSLKK